MKIPKDLLYTKDHEWVKVNEETCLVGITDFAQKSLGDIVFVELPDEGTEFAMGENFGAIESVKAASDIYIPVSGKVLEVNNALNDDPSCLNRDAYKNWLIKVELSDKAELGSLMTPEEYEAHTSK